MAEGDAKRWFKYGCLGCLGCIGLVLLVVGLAVGTAWFRSKSEKAEDRVLTHPVPAVPVEPIERPPEAASPPTRTETASVPRPKSKAQGTVILDLEDAEFHIQPGVAGDPIRVEATYDTTSFELEERSEEAKDGQWTYRVSFHRTRSASWMISMMQHMFSSIRPTVRVFLPPGVPIALETSIERGGLEAELGGTRVTSALFDISMGGLEVKVSEPLAEPMERLELKSHMGGGDFRSLGNASPRVIDIDSRMGGVNLDLRGAWQADADITLRGRMGGARVHLPDDVRIEGVPGRVLTGGQTGELKLPTLRFTSSSEMGDVVFE